jgi:hypothetical protein
LHWKEFPAVPEYAIPWAFEFVGLAVGDVRVTVGCTGPVPIVHETEPAALTFPAASVCVTT